MLCAKLQLKQNLFFLGAAEEAGGMKTGRRATRQTQLRREGAGFRQLRHAGKQRQMTKGSNPISTRNTVHCQHAPAAPKAEISRYDQPFSHSEQQQIWLHLKKKKKNSRD